MNDPTYGLGENVVFQLSSNVEAPARHNVSFDNFFTSHKLMRLLTESGYFATGTACAATGPIMLRFDKKNDVLAVRWNIV